MCWTKKPFHLKIMCLIWVLNDICSLTSPNKKELILLVWQVHEALRYIEFMGSLSPEGDCKERPCWFPSPKHEKTWWIAHVPPVTSFLVEPEWLYIEKSGTLHIKLWTMVAIKSRNEETHTFLLLLKNPLI